MSAKQKGFYWILSFLVLLSSNEGKREWGSMSAFHTFISVQHDILKWERERDGRTDRVRKSEYIQYRQHKQTSRLHQNERSLIVLPCTL